MTTQIINSKTENLIKTIPSLVMFRIGDFIWDDVEVEGWHVDVTIFDLDKNVLKVHVTRTN